MALGAAALFFLQRGSGPRVELATPSATAENEDTTVDGPIALPDGDRALAFGGEGKRRAAADASNVADFASGGAKSASEAGVLHLRARFVDEDGAPIGGVPIAMAGREDWTALGTLPADGRLEVPAVPASSLLDGVRFVFEAAGRFGMREAVAGGDASDLDLGRIVLRALGTLSGRILDPQGNPVVAAGVRLQSKSDLPYEWVSLPEDPTDACFVFGYPSDAAGCFRLLGLPLDVELEPRPALGRTHFGKPIPVRLTRARPSLEIELRTLEIESLSIEGRVVDSAGRAVPGADVVWDGPRPGSAQSDEDGAFLLRVAGDKSLADTRGTLTAARPGDAAWPAELADVPLGTRDVVLTLGAEHTFELVVVDSAGESVAWANAKLSVRSACSGWRSSDALFPLGREGIARLPAPPCETRLTVYAPGFATWVAEELVLFNLEGPLRVELARAPTLQGRITAAGRPVAGARVGILKGFASGRGASTSVIDPQDPVLVRVSEPDDRHDATTDADGRFTATPPEGSRFHLLVRAGGFPCTVGPGFDFAGERDVEVNLALERAGSLEGRLIGTLPEGFDLADADFLVAASNGSGIVRVASLDDDLAGAWTTCNPDPGKCGSLSPASPTRPA